MERIRPVTRDDISAGLTELGVLPGDVLVVHSSLKSFGTVQGGADAVIDALLDAVGPEGTVVVPTLSFQILKEKPYRFSVNHTPSGCGLVTEIFRARREALRSLHPVSSATAIGSHALYLTEDHLDTPCGATSPYSRAAELGGKVVFLGASLASNSLFHCAEEIAEPDYLGYAAVPDVEVTRKDGSRIVVTVRRYDCADRGVRRYLGNMEPVFQERGLLRRTVIGRCRACAIDGRANIDCCVEVLRGRPDYVLRELRE